MRVLEARSVKLRDLRLRLNKAEGRYSIAQAAKTLEDNRKLLGFSHFSLECDTLERVFLDLCARADSGSSIITATQDSVVNVEHVGEQNFTHATIHRRNLIL